MTFAKNMNWPHDPRSWFEFPAECLWYLLPGVLFHVIAFPILLGLMMVLGWFGIFRPRISTLILFQAYLLASAMIANGIWSCAVWGRLYWSVDYTSDFSTFMPITRRQIESSWGPDMAGGLNDITLAQLNLVWLAFAALVWILAMLATSWTISARRKQTGEQVVRCNRRSASSLNSKSSAAVHPL